MAPAALWAEAAASPIERGGHRPCESRLMPLPGLSGGWRGGAFISGKLKAPRHEARRGLSRLRSSSEGLALMRHRHLLSSIAVRRRASCRPWCCRGAAVIYSVAAAENERYLCRIGRARWRFMPGR